MALLVICQVHPSLATAAGAAAGALVNYFLQYHLTFACQNHHRATIPPYVLVVVIAWFVNLICFHWLNTMLLLSAGISQFITSALVAGINFVLYKKVVFHGRSIPK